MLLPVRGFLVVANRAMTYNMTESRPCFAAVLDSSPNNFIMELACDPFTEARAASLWTLEGTTDPYWHWQFKSEK
jgi:hypothetical protein